jgi:type I restriction enzyme S subunit
LTPFLYYILSKNYKPKGCYSRHFKFLLETKIFIPNIQVQEKIVSILDKFDLLSNSISEGLPKEIELRHKQYEYYRNKLLCFKEAKNE